jgi:hypothetical protein
MIGLMAYGLMVVLHLLERPLKKGLEEAGSPKCSK